MADNRNLEVGVSHQLTRTKDSIIDPGIRVAEGTATQACKQDAPRVSAAGVQQDPRG